MVNQAHREVREAGGYLHPDIEPKFYNGSIVTYEGEVYRVDGRSMEWDGTVTYALTPVSAAVVELRDGLGVPYQGISEVTIRKGDTVTEAPESGLQAVLPEYESLGRHRADGNYPKALARRPSEGAVVTSSAAGTEVSGTVSEEN